MTLLSLEDPVFIIDLSREVEASDAAAEGGVEAASAGPPEPPETPVRAVAIVIGPLQDPILLEIAPTRDTVLLDRLARLLRVAVRERAPVADVAIRGDDPAIAAAFVARRFPSFLYEGPPPHLVSRLPPALRAAFDLD